MIITENININFSNNLQNIETQLKASGIDPLRWAVVEVQQDKLTLSVSYEK